MDRVFSRGQNHPDLPNAPHLRPSAQQMADYRRLAPWQKQLRATHSHGSACGQKHNSESDFDSGRLFGIEVHVIRKCPPGRVRSTCRISARTLTAISHGESEPISSPIGAKTRAQVRCGNSFRAQLIEDATHFSLAANHSEISLPALFQRRAQGVAIDVVVPADNDERLIRAPRTARDEFRRFAIADSRCAGKSVNIPARSSITVTCQLQCARGQRSPARNARRRREKSLRASIAVQ